VLLRKLQKIRKELKLCQCFKRANWESQVFIRLILLLIYSLKLILGKNVEQLIKDSMNKKLQEINIITINHIDVFL